MIKSQTREDRDKGLWRNLTIEQWLPAKDSKTEKVRGRKKKEKRERGGGREREDYQESKRDHQGKSFRH